MIIPGAGDTRQRLMKRRADLAGSVLDADGEWTLQEGRFKKAELCKEYDLDVRLYAHIALSMRQNASCQMLIPLAGEFADAQPRDLRKLDSLAPNLVPIILTRKTCILMSILHVRALIKPDKVIIFDVPGVEESEAQRRFKLHLERNVKAGQAAEGQARALLGLNGTETDGAVDTASLSVSRGFVERVAGNVLEEGEEDDADVLPYEHR
jgi:hypothetical protein